MEWKLSMIAAAPGIAIGKTLWFANEKLIVESKKSDTQIESIRLKQARNVVYQNIQQILVSLQSHSEEAAIFKAHLMILDDPELISLADSELENGAEFAWEKAVHFYESQLSALHDEYLRSRAADIRDIGQQVLRVLLGKSNPDLSYLKSPVILLAKDLTPSDTGRMNKSMILGFATQEGSSTSHTAILAKALGIPAIVGAGEKLEKIPDGMMIILDGYSGEIISEPDDETIKKFAEKEKEELAHRNKLLTKAHDHAITIDGHRVEVVANVGYIEDAHNALANGAEGIGLLRTEFLYLDRAVAPSEEDQFEVYTKIFEIMGSHPIVIRTLDLGGDKSPSYMDLGKEMNPFLGWRAIRICLDRPDFFKDQLRAILRAAEGHDVRIMFPMIATLDELRQAKALLAEARVESRVITKVEVGIMVEIPSVVQMVDLFAPEVDFFSIGTNDLTQYTFAVDRTNPKVASIADACHPAILRQIQRVIQVAHANGKWVGVCGELAGDSDAIPILLGLGLDEFSMSAGSIPAAKEIIRQWNIPSAQKLVDRVINLDSAAKVRKNVASFKYDY
jgi:phosphoenolpyruvate-protein phosphotransferase (PTS system enzyme I)